MMMTMITDRLANVKGDFGVCYVDLTEDKHLFCGNCQVFPASGMVKLMALVECYRQIEEGKLNPNKLYTIRNQDRAMFEGRPYGALHFLHEGIRLTVFDLCNLMITVSDNLAFNLLVDILGMERINETFQLLGYHHMELKRKLFDNEKMEAGVENTISVKEIAMIFERMYKGQLISEKASRDMLALMTQHQRTSMIPYVFTEAVQVSHQTGFDEYALADGGIVYTKKPFILAMAAAKMDIREAEIIMRDITQICAKDMV
ncbi:MAG: serine hydrolase [Firmicutes bacterium]|nr:serine hydrolase [Bacillota bacterium]